MWTRDDDQGHDGEYRLLGCARFWMERMDGGELPALLRRIRDGECHAGDLVDRLRAAWLVVETETTSTGNKVVSFHAEGLRWLPVFTSLEQWAHFLVTEHFPLGAVGLRCW